MLTNATQEFGITFAKQLASRSDLPSLLSTAPQLVTQPLNSVLYNVRPFDVPVYVFLLYYFARKEVMLTLYCRASAVDYVGLIYLLILSVSDQTLCLKSC